MKIVSLTFHQDLWSITQTYFRKVRLEAFFFLALLFVTSTPFMSAQSVPEQDWFWQYPKPQGNDLLDVFLFNTERAVAVGKIGTVIQTTDGGTHWQVQHHAGATSYDLYSVHFTDSLNGWVAGGIRNQNKNVVLHTVDGGASWTTVLSDSSLCYLAVYFVDPDTGFVAGEDGILLRTTDGGTTWDTRKMDDYIGLGWLDIYQLYRITFIDKNHGWIVGAGYYGNQIYHTTDCGRNWQWNEQIILPKIYGPLFDMCWTDPLHGFIVGLQGIFLKSSDGGMTWQVKNLSQDYQNPAYGYFSSLFFADSLRGWIVSTTGFILETSDGGGNWIVRQRDIGLMRVRLAPTNPPSPPDVGWAVGGYGALFRTTNRGQDWLAQREKRHTFRAVHFCDDNTGWAVGDSGIIMHTTDGGTQWQKQFSADSVIYTSVYALDLPNAFAVGMLLTRPNSFEYKAIVSNTTDGGLSWNHQIDDSVASFQSVLFTGDSLGWISGGGTLLKTTDRGRTWVSFASGLPWSPYQIQFVDDRIGWISQYRGNQLLKTTDGGRSWNLQAVDSNLTMEGFCFADSLKGWAVGDYYYGNNIFRTTNGGKNWTAYPRAPLASYNAVKFVNQNAGWAAGAWQIQDNYPSAIFKTTNGGDNWYAQASPSQSELTALHFANEQTGWAIGDGIFKTSDGGGVVSVRERQSLNSALPTRMRLLQNYPNPFNPATVISYRLYQPGLITLKVYDLLGRLVATLVNQWQVSGQYKVRWEANNLASGVYFYTLRSGAACETKKLMLIR